MFLSIAFVSCQGDEETKSGKDILTSNSWKVSTYKINGEEIAIEDCQKDDYLTFAVNGTYTDFTGTLKCPGSIQTDFNGTWTLSLDEKTLTLTSFQGVLSLTVEITEIKLVLTSSNNGDIIVTTCIPFL
jgi:hypothetical protein